VSAVGTQLRVATACWVAVSNRTGRQRAYPGYGEVGRDRPRKSSAVIRAARVVGGRLDRHEQIEAFDRSELEHLQLDPAELGWSIPIVAGVRRLAGYIPLAAHTNAQARESPRLW